MVKWNLTSHFLSTKEASITWTRLHSISCWSRGHKEVHKYLRRLLRQWVALYKQTEWPHCREQFPHNLLNIKNSKWCQPKAFTLYFSVLGSESDSTGYQKRNININSATIIWTHNLSCPQTILEQWRFRTCESSQSISDFT